MSYSVQNIRNVCLVGHSGNGKTALAESLLFMTGAINRMGNSADGNTVCDYDPEEIRRQISISTAVAPLEYKGCKINLLDTPGAFDFSGEVMEALRAADAAILVCSAKDGISVGFEKVWKYCQERDMPRFIYISKTDEENSDYNATFNALRERYGTCFRGWPAPRPPWCWLWAFASFSCQGEQMDSCQRQSLKSFSGPSRTPPLAARKAIPPPPTTQTARKTLRRIQSSRQNRTEETPRGRPRPIRTGPPPQTTQRTRSPRPITTKPPTTPPIPPVIPPQGTPAQTHLPTTTQGTNPTIPPPPQ